MGWEDRHYYREGRGSGGFNPLMWLLTGRVKLFEVFGIRVYAHAAMIILAVLVLLFGLGQGSSVQDRVLSVTILFGIVLLHEFGHCFMARWVGGEADEILMTPIGGLAMARPPRRPLPTFLTVAAGPAVNVLICVVCGVALVLLVGASWDIVDPFTILPPAQIEDDWLEFTVYVWWTFKISYGLLLFNLWPIFPLDGGQMLQAILWPWVGWYKSMKFACVTGMLGAFVMAAVGIASGALLLVFIAISGFMTCFQMNQQLKIAGPGDFEDEPAFAMSTYTVENRSRRKANEKAERRLQKLKETEAAEQEQIDQILAKVSAQGMQSLTWGEKRALRKATENQRKRDQERREIRRR